MIRRLLPVVVVAAALIGLIAFNQLRGRPTQVSGFIEADEIRLGSRVGGRVAQVLVVEGQRVRRGQVLVELEPFDWLELQRGAVATQAAAQAEFERLSAGFRPEEILQAQARVAQLEARLELLKNGPREQEIQAARAYQQAAQSEWKLAQQNHQRILSLAAKGAAPQEDLDSATDKLQAAQAMLVVREQQLGLLLAGTRPEELAQARAQLEEAQHTLQLTTRGYRVEEIAAAKAAWDAAQSALDALQLRIEELKITAPVDGEVQALELHPGDLVVANAPVLSMLDRRQLWVRAYVPEDALALQIGQTLRVTVDSYPGEDFAGQVIFIAGQAEFTPSNVQTYDERVKQVFRIKVALTSGADRLRPGMAADVHLETVVP
jgi:multidrug resistance efflux pump